MVVWILVGRSDVFVNYIVVTSYKPPSLSVNWFWSGSVVRHDSNAFKIHCQADKIRTSHANGKAADPCQLEPNGLIEARLLSIASHDEVGEVKLLFLPLLFHSQLPLPPPITRRKTVLAETMNTVSSLRCWLLLDNGFLLRMRCYRLNPSGKERKTPMRRASHSKLTDDFHAGWVGARCALV